MGRYKISIVSKPFQRMFPSGHSAVFESISRTLHRGHELLMSPEGLRQSLCIKNFSISHIDVL